MCLDVQKKLAAARRDVENPNVRIVCDLLKKLLANQDSRALVFVSARTTCKALATFLKRELNEQGIGVSPLFGQEKRAGEDGKNFSFKPVHVSGREDNLVLDFLI